MADHLNRFEFDSLDEADIAIVFDGRHEYSRAMETRYPKETDRALREVQIRGFRIDDATKRYVDQWIATGDLATINGAPVLYASDIDQLCDDLAGCGDRFLSTRLRYCIEAGVTLFSSILAERGEASQ